MGLMPPSPSLKPLASLIKVTMTPRVTVSFLKSLLTSISLRLSVKLLGATYLASAASMLIYTNNKIRGMFRRFRRCLDNGIQEISARG